MKKPKVIGLGQFIKNKTPEQILTLEMLNDAYRKIKVKKPFWDSPTPQKESEKI